MAHALPDPDLGVRERGEHTGAVRDRDEAIAIAPDRKYRARIAEATAMERIPTATCLDNGARAFTSALHQFSAAARDAIDEPALRGAAVGDHRDVTSGHSETAAQREREGCLHDVADSRNRDRLSEMDPPEAGRRQQHQACNPVGHLLGQSGGDGASERVADQREALDAQQVKPVGDVASIALDRAALWRIGISEAGEVERDQRAADAPAESSPSLRGIEQAVQHDEGFVPGAGPAPDTKRAPSRQSQRFQGADGRIALNRDSTTTLRSRFRGRINDGATH